MKRVTVLAEASNDLLGIITWYGSQSSTASARFYAEYQKILSHIQMRPKQYAMRDEFFRRANLHRFPYYVIYRELETTIEIIAVAHASRLPGRWQGRLPEL